MEGLLSHSDQKDSVGSLAVLSRLLDLLDNVLARSEIDKGSSTELLKTHLLLLLASIDGNDPQAHSFCVLLGKGSKTATGSDNRNSLTRTGTRFLETLVNGDTGAQYGCNCVEGNVLVKASDMCCLGDGVLLESAVDGVAGEEGLATQRLIWS